MTQPVAYVPATAFNAFAPAGFPNLGANLDTEYQALKTTTDQIRTNLAILQRDDTNLANGIVTPDSLSTLTKQLIATTGWEPKGAWLTATSYAVKDVVTQGGIGYVCLVAHTSGVFATDLAANKWAAFTTAYTTTAFSLSLLDDADAATARATLGAAASGANTDLTSVFLNNTGLKVRDTDASHGLSLVPGSNLTADRQLTITTGDVARTIDISASSLVLSAFGAQIIDDTNAAAVMTTLGISAFAQTILDDANAAAVHATLGLTGRQTVWIPAGAMTARNTNGAAEGLIETATNRHMIRTLDFDATTQEFAQAEVQMPENWNEGTITAIFVWSHAATATNFGVTWGIQGVAISNDDPIDAAFGTAQNVTDTGGTTNDLYRSPETAAVTLAGSPVANDVARFQVYRLPTDGGDTLAIDARLHGIVLFYTTAAVIDVP